MESATSINPLSYEGPFFPKCLAQLSNALCLLVPLAKNIAGLLNFIPSVELCLFLCNSDHNNSFHPLEQYLNSLHNLN